VPDDNEPPPFPPRPGGPGGGPGFDWGDEPPRLCGRRVDLRGLTAGDAPAIFAIFGDPAVMTYWSSPPLTEVATAASMIEEIQEHFRAQRGLQWGICWRDSDEVLGTCTLFHLDRPHGRAEIGYALRSSAWGQGLASEALALLFGFAFGPLGLHRLEADVDPDNQRSLRLLERHGFRREGYLRQRWHHLGQLRDAVFLGLLRPEWPGAAKP
jgi:[ribosomal protein S5]-alanine N-acetyltransferase